MRRIVNCSEGCCQTCDADDYREEVLMFFIYKVNVFKRDNAEKWLY